MKQMVKRFLAAVLFALIIGLIVTATVFTLDSNSEELCETIQEVHQDLETIVITDESECEVPMIRNGVNEAYAAASSFGFKPLELPIDEDIQKYLYQVCNDYGIDYAFALGTIQFESTFNEKAKHSNTNGTIDRGLCQVNSCWVDECRKLGFIDSAEDLFNPYKCIDCGMWILSSCVEQFGNTESAYYAYNTGRYREGSNKNSRMVWSYKSIFEEMLR